MCQLLKHQKRNCKWRINR